MKHWTGSAQLDFELQDQQTNIVSSYTQAPLKIQRPFYPEAENICHTILVHTAGGMVGGDRLQIDLNLKPNASALITTSAAGKIYRSESEPCLQHIKIHLEPGAICEWVPQETILFEGANFQQQLSVTLEPGALWMGMELFRFGRTARGETFATGMWRSHSSVWQHERPLWIDRSCLTGDTRHSPNTLGTASVMGTLVVLGMEFERDAIAQIRDRLNESPTAQLGMSRLQQGILCRYLGPSTRDGRAQFLKIWESLRQIYAGRAMCIPRVWQL